MRWLALICCVMMVCETSGQAMSRHQLRMCYLDASQRRSALDSLLHQLEGITSATPCQESYLGICYALTIEHTESNWAKLRLVYKAKNYLNHAIERDPDDVELHFLRFALEHYLPSFLGLNKHIADDLKVIFDHPNFVDDEPRLKKNAVQFLLDTKRCSPLQTALLEKQLANMVEAPRK